jgi:hypothetical protein
MIQLVPQLNILLAYEPVDFRKGIDSLVALCKTRLDQDLSPALFSSSVIVPARRSNSLFTMARDTGFA